MRHALVTGGAGFLGSHLIDRLRKNRRVTVADDLSTGKLTNLPPRGEADEPITFVQLDVTQPIAEKVMASFEPDEIYHLACPASPVAYQRDPVKTLRTCSEGTLAVLNAAAKCGASVLLASTSEVYGDPVQHPQRETYWGHVNPRGPRSMYDEGKRYAEALAAAHYVSVRVARIFNTYGPRMAPDDGRVVSNFIVQALRGEPLTIYGDGGQTRSLCYVDDTVAALEMLMASDYREPVNIGNPWEVTMLELAMLVLKLTESASKLERRPLPGDDPRRRCPDTSRANEVLKWRPLVGIDEGLARTIRYFQEVLP